MAYRFKQLAFLLLLLGAAFATTVSIDNGILADTKTVTSAINQISTTVTMMDTNKIYHNYTIHYYVMNITNNRLASLTLNLSNFVANNKIKLSNITLYTATAATELSPTAGKTKFNIMPTANITIPLRTTRTAIFSFITPNWQKGNFNFSIASAGLANIRIDPEITECGELSERGETYVLTKDVDGYGWAYCFQPTDSGITLDCQGHTIKGWDSGSPDYYSAIYQGWEYSETNPFTAKNCVITDWIYGARLACGNCETTLDNLTITADNKYAKAGIATDPSFSAQQGITINNTKISITKQYSVDSDWAAYGILITESASILIENTEAITSSPHIDSCGISIGGGGSNAITLNNVTSIVPADAASSHPAFCTAGSYLGDTFIYNSNFTTLNPTERAVVLKSEGGTAYFGNVSVSATNEMGKGVEILQGRYDFVDCRMSGYTTAVDIGSTSNTFLNCSFTSETDEAATIGNAYNEFTNCTFTSPVKSVLVPQDYNNFTGNYFNTSNSYLWVQDDMNDRTNYFNKNRYRGIESSDVVDSDLDGYGDDGTNYPVGGYQPDSFQAAGLDYNPIIVTPFAGYGAGADADGSSVARSYITANATANSAWLNNITLRLYNSTGSLINSTSTAFDATPPFSGTKSLFANWTGLADGTYYFNATAYYVWNWNDNSQITAITETRNITIDRIPPNISIISPTNTTYTSLPILINITNSSAANTWYNWNATNTTYTAPINISPANGYYTLYAWVNDSAGNKNSTNVSFTVSVVAATGNLTVNYTMGGIASGNNSTFTPPKNLTINATANSGYYFVNWTITEGNCTLLNASSAVTNVSVLNTSLCNAQANFAVIPPAICCSSLNRIWHPRGLLLVSRCCSGGCNN